MKSKVVICTPCYEMNGKGSLYLEKLLDTASIQRGITFSVLVSDQSIDDSIEKVCKKYSFVDRVRFDGPRLASSNINNAMMTTDADIIKIMFQDDFFADDESLLSCVEPILRGEFWSATACIHTDSNANAFFRPMLPRYHDTIHHGVNTISSPSVITTRKDDSVLFDECVSMLLDVDWYKRMQIAHGNPHINNRVNVVNRLHEDSLQATINRDRQEDVDIELEYIKRKYGEK